MPRQIGPWLAEPHAMLLEERVCALETRLLALEARLRQGLVAPRASGQGRTGGMEPILEELTEAESLHLIEQAVGEDWPELAGRIPELQGAHS